MSKTIDLDNKITNLYNVRKQSKQDVCTANSQETRLSLVTLSPSSVNSLLSNQTINQLCQLQEFTACQIEVQYQSKVDLNSTPHLSWLKGRDNNIYDGMKTLLSNGANTMRIFSEIVDRTKDEQVLSQQDWWFIESHIQSFENGLERNREFRSKSNDPIVHQVLDYIYPKTQLRIEVLKQFLVGKEKAPALVRSEFELVEISIDQDNQNLFISPPNKMVSSKITELLDLLAKDLDWYDWYLGEGQNLATEYYFKYTQVSLALYTSYKQI